MVKSSRAFSECKGFLVAVTRVYFTLLKVMVPALVVVKILTLMGGTEIIALVLSPFMAMVGLPQEMGLVWATAMLTNLYTGMVVFFEFMGNHDLSVAQVSVLGVMMLLAHALPVEGAVAKLSGIAWKVTLPLRIVGGFVLGFLTHTIYQLGGWQQQQAVMMWQPEKGSDTLLSWTGDQVTMLISIFFIIAALMLLLRVLRWLGIEAVIQKMLSPLLNALTIGKEATNVCVIGLTLGLSFGAGLLIDEAKSGRIKQRDILLSVCFLGLAHSVIEDTILILLLGADIMSILWGRLLFAFVVMIIIARWVKEDVTKSS